MSSAHDTRPHDDPEHPGWVVSLRILPMLLAFFVGIRGMGTAFELLGADVVDRIFEASANPFVGLLVGILSTSILQSSSATTSMVVGLVGAPSHPLPIASAIPMILGANIGTTVTSTVVSLGHVTRPAEFRRAIAAGTCDDFFNLVAVAILLPLELATGFLQHTSRALVGLLPSFEAGLWKNPIALLSDAILDPTLLAIRSVSSSDGVAAIALLCLTVALIFGALVLLVSELRRVAGPRMERAITPALDASPLVGIATGAAVTAMVQSSSLTLSLLVPLAGTGVMTLERIFPIALGANIGTTVTAFLAATAMPPETLHVALQISLVHMLFNLMGIALIYPVPAIRRVPLALSEWIARTAVRSKLRAAAWVVAIFYLIPFVALAVWRGV